MKLLSKLYNFVLYTTTKYNIDESHGLSHAMDILGYAVTLLGVVPYAVNKCMGRWGRTVPSHRPRGRASARAIFYGRQKELLEWRVARRGDTHPRACGVVYRLLRASGGPSRKVKHTYACSNL